MRVSSKLKVFLIIFFIAIFAIIAARHFIGLHFKKKFSVRPAPGVIVEQVERSLFYKSIETFGTALAQNSKTYRIKTNEVSGKLNIDNRFVKKGEIILRLKSGEEVIADFAGKLGKREIAQGVLGSESLIVTLDDLKKIVIDIKVPENYVSILKPGLKAETIQGSTAFVYTVKDETAEKKNIEIGKRNFGKVSVISGINEGDLVITEGVSKVRNNAKIKIINPRN